MKPQPEARLERLLASLGLMIIALISLANVVVRYVTDASFAFTEEFSVFLLVVVTFAGAAVAVRRNGHIRITLVERALPPRLRRALILFQGLAGLVVLGLIVGYGAQMAWQEYHWQSLSPGLGVPLWWYLVWLPLLALAMLVRLVQQIRDRLRGGLDDEC